MVLSQRKIPIITGINDVPSASGQANHPNASLLCQSYNALIDNELTDINNTLNSILSSNKPEAINSEYYLDTSIPSNGDGTEANPFNSVAALVNELNSKTYTNRRILVLIAGDTDLGNFTLNVTAYGENNDLPPQILIRGKTVNEIITIGNINTNIKLMFFDIESVNFGTITIRGDVEFISPMTITGNLIYVLNGLIAINHVNSVNNVRFRLHSSCFVSKNSIFNNVYIDGNCSDVSFDDVSGSNINFWINSTKVRINECDIDNTSGDAAFLWGFNSDIRITELNFFPNNDPETPILGCQGSSSLMVNIVNFNQYKINGYGAFTVFNNVILGI